MKNGRKNGHSNGKVRVAIVGVGNCASSFVQGVHYYRNASHTDFVPGLMHVDLGGYHISDIEFVAAFDIDKTKVGLDLSKAIFAGPNNTVKFSDVPKLDVKVERGMTHDGLGKYLSEIITKAPGPTADIVKLLKDTKTDVLINFLPVGSEMATKWYVEQAIEAGCAFVNGIPVFIASSEYWAKRFRDAKLPILGDDVKSQVGATILHRQLADEFLEVVRRLAWGIAVGLRFLSRVALIDKDLGGLCLKLLPPAMNHRGGHAKLAAHRFQRRIALQAFEDHFQLEFRSVLLALILHGSNTFRVLPVFSRSLYQVLDTGRGN